MNKLVIGMIVVMLFLGFSAQAMAVDINNADNFCIKIVVQEGNDNMAGPKGTVATGYIVAENDSSDLVDIDMAWEGLIDGKPPCKCPALRIMMDDKLIMPSAILPHSKQVIKRFFAVRNMIGITVTLKKMYRVSVVGYKPLSIDGKRPIDERPVVQADELLYLENTNK